jgi:magnesium transporter
MEMIVACAGYEDGRRLVDLGIANCASFVDRPGRFVWVGLFEPSEEILRTLQRQFGLHELALEDALRAHQRPKLDVFGDSLFMVLRTARLAEAGIVLGETHVFAGKGYVISVRHGDTSSYGAVRQRCEASPRLLANGEDYVLYAIMNFVVENYLPIVEQMERHADAIDELVQSAAVGRRTIHRIARLRRDLLRLRRASAPMLDVCNRLQRFAMPFIDEEIRPYYRDVRDHVIRINESIDILRDMLTAAFETHLLLAANRQGEVTRQLAGWAAILAVPTAIAGIYGMNFEHMPELRQPWGYPLVLLVIVGVCSGLFLRFRRIGWI